MSLKLCVALMAVAAFVPGSRLQGPRGQTSAQRSTSAGLMLLHRLQDSLGGARRIAAVSDLDETIRAQAWDARGAALGEVRKRTRWMQHPSTLRLDQIGPRGTYVLFFDGDASSGWEILPDLTSADRYKTTGTPVDLVDGELQFAREYLADFELNLWLADVRGYTVTAPRPNVVRIEHGGSATEITLEADSGLPARSAGVSLADPDRPVPSELRYEAWQAFAGVRFPTRRVKYLSGMKRGEVTTEALHVNVGLTADQLARKPADFAPEIAR